MAISSQPRYSNQDHQIFRDEYPSQSDDSPQYEYHDSRAATLQSFKAQQIQHNLQATPRSSTSAALHKIIAIPATSPKLGSPFLRAYAPALNDFGISQDTFLEFVDHLNRAAVASPPVQVLGLAGNIVGMVPLHTAQIVGGTVSAAATLTTIAMSKGRVEVLLRQANRDIFAPKGLCARVAKLEAVARISNMPVLNSKGNLDKKVSLLLPLDDSEESQSLATQHRRIEALSPWISPLQIEELPAIQSPTNAFSKMHASVSERQRRKEEKKTLKDRQKIHKDWLEDSQKVQEDYDKEMQKLDEEERKIYSQASKHTDRKLLKIKKEREKIKKEYQKEIEKVEKDRKKDDKEEEMMRKILFLVVQQADSA